MRLTKLSGLSQAVAADPYELRIVAPPTPQSWKTIRAELTAGDRAAAPRSEYTQSGPCVRATITSPTSRLVGWTLHFAAGPAETALPPKVTGLAAKTVSFSQVVLTWESAPRVAVLRGTTGVVRLSGQTCLATRMWSREKRTPIRSAR